MTNKIISIAGGKRQGELAHPADPEIVETLEMVLAEAKAGRIHALAIAGICYDAHIIMYGNVSADTNVFEMIGVIDMLKMNCIDGIAEQLE